MGLDIVQDAEEKVKIVRQKLLMAQNREKSYSDKRRCDLKFSIEDHELLKVSPTKEVKWFGMREKLNPHYIKPFEVLERISSVAYPVALPPILAEVHDVFHMSLLYKYVPDPIHIISYPPLDLQEDLSYDEYPVEILNRQEKALWSRSILYVRVL